MYVQQSRDGEILLPRSCMDMLGCIGEQLAEAQYTTHAGLAFPKTKLGSFPSLGAVNQDLVASCTSLHIAQFGLPTTRGANLYALVQTFTSILQSNAVSFTSQSLMRGSVSQPWTTMTLPDLDKSVRENR